MAAASFGLWLLVVVLVVVLVFLVAVVVVAGGLLQVLLVLHIVEMFCGSCALCRSLCLLLVSFLVA